AGDVRAFAMLTGDTNPLHLDDEYASGTRFGGCIVHGALLNGVISALLGTRLPGQGTVYLSQTVRFPRPLRVGAAVVARVRVLHIERGSVATCLTECLDPQGREVMTGEAVVLLPRRCRDRQPGDLMGAPPSAPGSDPPSSL